ncbi:hypothetical protein [Streptomyces sp. NPDC059894]|uniref:hypothetical protein n=1 Tax=unclassified Streptomyces TaxID=2593676 RepID=UPI00366766D6
MYGTLRSLWAEILTGGDIDPADDAFTGALALLSANATGLWNSLSADASANSLWPGLELSTPASMTSGYKQLATLATAYATPGTTADDGSGRALYGNAALGSAIVGGLDFLHAQIHHADTTETGDWWEWEIGSPQARLNTAILTVGAADAPPVPPLPASATKAEPNRPAAAPSPPWPCCGPAAAPVRSAGAPWTGTRRSPLPRRRERAVREVRDVLAAFRRGSSGSAV